MKIGIAGTGRLGLSLALCLDEVGHTVSCYDINTDYLKNINDKTFYTYEPSVVDMLEKSNLQICYEYDNILKSSDIIFIIIQTPSTKEGTYNHEYINNFIEKCIIYAKNNIFEKKTLVISSTVMPEYTNSIKEKLSGLPYDIFYNPMFIAQGSIIYDLKHPNLILLGSSCSSYSSDIIEDIHKSFIKNVPEVHKMTTTEAEITKIAINCFITTKISFANMIGDLLHKKECDSTKVLNAIGSDSRIGNKCLQYGYGFGGPCFPRDNRALFNYAQTQNMYFELCKTTDNLNENHLLYQYNNIKNTIDPIEFTYITYKDNSDILEESQKLKLACLLSDYGCKIIINERDFVITKLQQLYGDKFVYSVI